MALDVIGGLDTLKRALKDDLCIADGEVTDASGNPLDTVQKAIDAASDWVWIPPATFNEAVTISTVGLTVEGSGYDTLIDGGTSGSAISVTADDVTVRSFSVKTDPAGGHHAFSGGSGTHIDGVVVRDAGNFGFNFFGDSDSTVVNCVVETSDGAAFRTDESVRIGFFNCVSLNAGGDGFRTQGPEAAYGDIIIANCIALNSGNHGMSITTDDTIVIGNRIHNSGNDGIFIQGTDDIMANNRISGSTNSDIDSASATGLESDANLTGAAN